MAYCALDDVKRLLRVLSVSGNTQHKIRFSDSYTVPEIYSANTGTGILKGVEVLLNTYAGNELWHITFSSATAFTLYRGEGTASSDGTGSTSSNFTSTSGIIKITTSQWSGTPVAGDQFKFRTDSNVSTKDANEFLEDATIVVDGKLGEFISDDYLPFSTPNNLLKRAVMYISSSIIFTSVFSSLSAEQVPTLVRSWYNQGIRFADLFLSSIPGKNIHKYARYARFASREPLFAKVGIKEAAGVEDAKGEIETISVAYDEDYNEEEQIGST
uniref:Uncharacterized protein n=1 Tax=viral metagenome TaxID=1070528 RepID=A0A6M3IIY7_9ZZZZ